MLHGSGAAPTSTASSCSHQGGSREQQNEHEEQQQQQQPGRRTSQEQPPASSATPPAPLLALPGPNPAYCLDFAAGQLLICGQPLFIHQEGGQGRGTGWSVWDGAVAAAKHLEACAEQLRASLQPQSVLELGSGTGLAGLAAAAALGLPTTLTDLPEVLPSLEVNLRANPSLAPLITAAPCDWTAAQPAAALAAPYGLVFAADCVWLEPLVAPFVGALQAVCGPASQVLLAYQSRSSRVDALLFGLLRRAGFASQPAPLLAGEPPRGEIDLYWLTPLQSEDE